MKTQTRFHVATILSAMLILLPSAVIGQPVSQNSDLTQETCRLSGVLVLTSNTIISCSDTLQIAPGTTVDLKGHSLKIFVLNAMALPEVSTGGLVLTNSAPRVGQELEITVMGTVYGFLHLMSAPTHSLGVRFEFGTVYDYWQSLEGVSPGQVQMTLDGQETAPY
jgi:hypothetical protein